MQEYLKKIIEIGKRGSCTADEPSYFDNKLPNNENLKKIVGFKNLSSVELFNRLLGNETTDKKDMTYVFINFIKGCHIIEKNKDGGFGSTSYVHQLMEGFHDEKIYSELYNWVAFNGGNHFIDEGITYTENKRKSKDAAIRRLKILEHDKKVHREAVAKKQKKRDAHVKISQKNRSNYKEFKNKFQKMNNEQLLNAFNKEVGNSGWTSSRSSYLAALHEEFQNRGYDYSAIGNKKYLSLAKRIKLNDKKIEIDTKSTS